jgi:hypothetical protein
MSAARSCSDSLEVGFSAQVAGNRPMIVGMMSPMLFCPSFVPWAKLTAEQVRTIYDYVDVQEPMVARMAAKRAAGYRSLGYRKSSSEAFPAKAAQQSLNLRYPERK